MYVVGHYPKRGSSDLIEYVDIKKACATFIKREIEDIRAGSK